MINILIIFTFFSAFFREKPLTTIDEFLTCKPMKSLQPSKNARIIHHFIKFVVILAALGLGPLLLKAENLQRTGSFKPRGAFNAVLQLTADERARGVITLSAGNHGQAVAWAARELGAPARIFMPQDSAMAKVDARYFTKLRSWAHTFYEVSPT